MVAILNRVIGAAEADDIVQIDALFEELAADSRAALNALSPEFVALTITDSDDALFVALSGRLTVEEAAYIEALQGGANEFGVRNAAFGRAAQATYPTAERLMIALAEAGAGEAMQAVYDVISEIEPPDSLISDHALVVAYYQEAVRVDRLIGEAARAGDAATFLVQNAALGRAVEQAAFQVHPAVCAILFNPSLCSAGVDVPLGAYEHDVRLAMRDLMVRLVNWGAFGLLPAGSDDTIVEAAAELAPLAIEPITEARALIAALDPPPDLEADHAVLLSYLDELLAQQQSILAATEVEDAASVRTGIEATDAARCTASLALTDAARPAVGFFFGPEPPAAGSCPGA